MIIDYTTLFQSFDTVQDKKQAAQVYCNPMQAFLQKSQCKSGSAFQRMQMCRDALDGIDRHGWQRSFHQRLFHDNFIRACSRIFWKTEPAGTFAKDHQKILEMNGWDHLSQEILVSTPRRCLLLILLYLLTLEAHPMFLVLHCRDSLHAPITTAHAPPTQIYLV
jgi:hypothetical protein